jgi:hypothetical protein
MSAEGVDKGGGASLCSPELDFERETRPPLDLAFSGLLVFAFPFIADGCREEPWNVDASPVPIGGMRAESILENGVVTGDFDANFCRGAFGEGLPAKELVATGANFFFVGAGKSLSVVSESTLGRRLLVDEEPSSVRRGSGTACRDGEEPSLARDLPMRLGLGLFINLRETAGSSTCI